MIITKLEGLGFRMEVCVIGLGTVGAPTASYIQKHGFSVFGCDLVERSIEGVETFTNWGKVPQSEVYVVAVSSDSVESVCEEIAEKSKNALVLIESTVRVGTCRRISERLGLKLLAHCPHRYWAEDPVNHGVGQLRVIGALNEESLEKSIGFYKSLDVPLHVCSTIEVAEMCKIAENAYRFVQIAFAEELKMICDANEVPFKEVREACNTKWNTTIQEAREGILGACLPKDTRYLKLLAQHTPLIDGAIAADHVYQEKARKNIK